MYFRLMDRDILTNQKKKEEVFSYLGFIYKDDSPKEKAFFMDLFTQLIGLLARPFQQDEFDFADNVYFETMYAFGERLSNMKELRESKKPRGQKDAIYLNRTYFGLYNILHDLKARIQLTAGSRPV